MSNITFVIFTYNEEARIERVIKNFKDYGKILLADNNSTDGTHAIARKYGCDIWLREKDYVFVETQEVADIIYSKITTDWIYWGFSDEMLEKDTLEQVKNIIEADKHDIISIDRKNYFYGSFCHDLYHARTNKIFRKHAIDFTDNPIHNMGKVAVPNERVYHLPDKYFVHHFISNTAASYLNVINRYTDSEIQFNFKAKTSVWYFLIYALKYAFKDYFYTKGYKAGFKGLALTELMLFYSLLKNIKHFEKENQLNRDSIELTNDVYRDKILNGF